MNMSVGERKELLKEFRTECSLTLRGFKNILYLADILQRMFSRRIIRTNFEVRR